LLNALLGFVKPAAGKIMVNGCAVRAGHSGSTTRLRRESIGVVFQDGRLLTELSALENVALSALLAGRESTAAFASARGLLESFGLRVTDRPVSEYSGGEQQRVAVARALVNQPSVVLADEPTGSLDPDTRDAVCGVLFDLPQRYECGLVVVTHDPAVAQRADVVYRLRDGGLDPVEGVRGADGAVVA
jgi:putative ABC transport system ATP-binding protein/lipoprotein-releasing system ATP-binding protein